MGELFSAGELISAFLKIGKGTYNTAKFVGKVGYGAYAKSKEKDENAKLQRQALIDETGELERLAKLGYEDAQYEYGKALFTYGNAFNLQKDRAEGLRWIEKAAENGHIQAEDFLEIFGEE